MWSLINIKETVNMQIWYLIIEVFIFKSQGYLKHIQVHLNKLECREKSSFFSCKLFQKVKLSYISDSLHVK